MFEFLNLYHTFGPRLTPSDWIFFSPYGVRSHSFQLYSKRTYNYEIEIFTLRIESARVTIEKSLGKMYKNPLSFLGLPRQRELGKELSESHVQRVPFKAEVSQVFLSHRSTKVVAVNHRGRPTCYHTENN